MAFKSNNYRKFVAASATATLVATAVTPAFAAEFTDVNKNYKEAVDYLVNNNIAQGTSKTEFGTVLPITRGDAAVMIAKALKLDTDNAPASAFTDLNSRVKGAVNALYAKGVISGKTEKTFEPSAQIKRAEMAKIIANAYDLKAGDTKNEFTDVNSNWDPYVDKLLANKITVGKTPTTFAPDANVTRGEFALFMYRAKDFLTAPTVKSVSPVADITVNQGAELTLPSQVEVTLSNGEKTNKAVQWNRTGLDLDKAGEYTLKGDVADTDIEATVKVIVKSVAPEVTEVKAANATQVVVQFNQPVDKDTLFDANGNFKTANLALTALDGQSPAAASTTKATLSKDGKTLTVTTNNPLEKRYKVVVDNVKTADGKAIEKFDQVVTFAADTTAPAIVGTEKLNATQVKVKFSEPIKALSTAGTSVTFKDADGKTIASGGNGVAYTSANGDSEIVFTLGSDVPVNKEITATFVGVQDQVGNVMTPNPSTVSFQKGDKDGVAPTVSGITQTGAKKFTVKFSEAVQKPAAADITVNGTAVSSVEQVGDDSTTFEFTTAALLDGAATVASANPIVDLSGETATFSKVVTFVKDEVAPKVVSTNVSKDSTNGKEYLDIVFDKDVVLSTASGSESKLSATGTYVKDYITNNVTLAGANNNIDYKDTANKKVVRVELDTFLGTTTDVKGAVYDLDLTFANVESVAGAAVTTGKAKFTRGEDGTPTTSDVVKVTSIAQGADNDKVNVTFDKPVDGASATNVANYKVDGAVVESVTLAAASGTTQVATLNLKKDSNTFSGTRNVTVSNVKALGSTKVMETTVQPVILNENVRPTVKSAKLTSTTGITLTFSENIKDGTADDFELLVGGKSVATPVKVDVTPGTGADANTATITLSTALTADQLTQGISLKALDSLDITDAVTPGNKLSVPANITVAQ
ncbi:S-layer homology domain-containing protein [Pseudobacillus wudalianchiensis]|uniref:S-layer homology domain-containing protein n=1 Tax=Pseudobacillus wudalianchiensis TaxID=1743143 RepID=UPI000981DA60|nr:S-layer homology domain-containing protein [Bacillus wudalianchiensis]